MPTNFEKWVNFLEPNTLKGNLMNCSLYIAVFESFNDYVVEEVKMFFNNGFIDQELTFSPRYTTSVLNRNRSPLFATLLWLQEQGAIESDDLVLFERLKKYRNKLAHEMIELLFEGSFDDFSENLSSLMALRIKIEKWWIINIDIPTSSDFATKAIEKDDIQTSSQVFYKIITDMLTGNEETANYYYKEFLKRKDEMS